MGDIPESDLTHVRKLRKAVLAEVGKVFIGAVAVPEMLLTALLARGHVLLEGVPGVAKTTLVKAFSATLGCLFKRIQFTPDLMPSDITGTYVLDMRNSTFSLREGPIFGNIVLGDEINRAPAKTQAALLEAMQEGQVTIEGDTRVLPPPFMVLATQNPIEHEGTYPLPEAQVDRFMLKLQMKHPPAAVEKQMLTTYHQKLPALEPILDPDTIIAIQHLADRVHIDDELLDYILGLSQFTRDHRRIYLGVSPRASLMLMQVAKAHALLHGRGFVLPDDVKTLAGPVLAHRLLLAPDAELEGVKTNEIIDEALEKVRYQRRR